MATIFDKTRELLKGLNVSNVKAQAKAFPQFAQSTQFGKGVKRTLQQPVALSPRQTTVMNTLQTPARLGNKLAEGFGEGSTYGLVNVPVSGSQNKFERLAYLGGYGAGLVNPLNPVNKLAGAYKATKLFSPAEQGASSLAARYLARGGASSLLTKGLTNAAQGLPYSAAYATAKSITGQKYTGKDALVDTGFDVALGAMPLAGAMIRSGKFSKKIAEIVPELSQTRRVIETIPSLNSRQRLLAYDQIENTLKQIGYKPSKELRRMIMVNPDEYLNFARGLIDDALYAAKNPELSIGANARALKKSSQGGLTDVTKASKGVEPQAVDPVSKITALLSEAKPMRGQQEALYAAERARRVARVAGAGKIGGEKGYFAQLGQLKGELPKVQFSRIRQSLDQTDIDSLFDMVEANTNLRPLEKVTAKSGLAKLLGAEGGTVPNNSELRLLAEIYPPEFIKAIQSNRTMMQKLLKGTTEVLNLPRAIMSTADLSAPLRQGVFLVGRPKQWAPAFKDMFKYAFSEGAYVDSMAKIKTKDTYPLMRDSKLALTEAGSTDLLKREEAFMSNLLHKVPVVGRLSKASDRAYSGFLTKLRADTFDDLVKKARASGQMKPGMERDIARFVNSATGRGDLGKTLNTAAPILNATFFSPRLIASRLNLLNPVYYAQLNPFVRKEALKSLFTFAATATSILTLASLGGADVEKDPRNADFGKIKVGNTRYDILGGFQQYFRLASQLATGKVISSTTGREITLGEGYKPLTRKDILMRFFESKEAPVASFVTGMLQQQTGTGEPFNAKRETVSRFMPMFLQDAYDLIQEYGPEGVFAATPGLFGVGSQTYGKQEYVTGKNQVGQDVGQIRPVRELSAKISDKLFGAPPLGSTAGYSVDAYIDQLNAMPREEAAKAFDQIIKTDPEVAKKINQALKEREQGITVNDKTLKSKGVANGDRAMAIAKQFKKLKTNEEKAKLWDEYVQKKVITKEVAEQLALILEKQ